MRSGGTRAPDDAAFRGVIEAMADGVLLVDDQSIIVFANARAEALLGYSRGELVGIPTEQLWPERYREERKVVRARFAAPRELPMGSRAALVAVRKDGSEVPVDIGLSPLSTPQGALLVAQIRDASERLAVERGLREANERSRLIIDEAPVGMAIGDLEGQLLRVNRAFCELVGYGEGELTSMSFKDITHPDDLGAEVELVKRLLRGEIPRYRLEKRYVRKDGSTVRVLIWVSVVRDEAGMPLYFIALVEDVTERWRASEALRRSEMRYRALIDQAPVGVFVADLDGRYLEVNAAGCRMLGCQPEDLIGKTIVDLIPPEDVPRLEASKQHMLTPGSSHIAEWRLKHKEGRWVPVQVSAAILPDGRWQAFVDDISTRKQVEQALRESEERLRRAQRVARLGSWEWDLRTGVVSRSPDLLTLYGLDPSEVHPEALALILQVPPEERQQVVDLVNEAIKAGRPYSVEHRMLRDDGEEHVLLEQGEPVIEDGAVVRYTGTTLDITELRRAEREREEALRELRAVLEECPVGITLVREGGRVLEPNAMARRMLGASFSAERGVAQLVGRVLSPEGQLLGYDELPVVKALAGERTVVRELLFDRDDGHRMPVEVNAAPVISPNGHVSSVVVVWRDISQLKEIDRLRAEWNSIVAHDLRQPVNNIHMFTQFLARQPVEWSAQAQVALNQIKKTTSRLARMTFDLLDLSRLDVGRLPLEKKQVDLASLARECAARASLEAPDRPLDVHEQGELPLVDGDPDRLTQVLENLLSNAIKYGAPGTPVEVDLGCDGQLLTVSVTNQGKGIEPSEIERVFERFQRIHAGKGGVGLGLSITKGLVEAHGGHIGVQSVPGEKTTFWFTLPAARG